MFIALQIKKLARTHSGLVCVVTRQHFSCDCRRQTV